MLISKNAPNNIGRLKVIKHTGKRLLIDKNINKVQEQLELFIED